MPAGNAVLLRSDNARPSGRRGGGRTGSRTVSLKDAIEKFTDHYRIFDERAEPAQVTYAARAGEVRQAALTAA